MALEFLKRDIFNINKYFEHLGVQVFGLRDCFKFVTHQSLLEENYGQVFESMASKDDTKNELFMDINIPQTLFDFNIQDLDRMLDERIYEDMEELEN